MCRRESYKKKFQKYEKIIFFASLKSLKKVVGSRIGSGAGFGSMRIRTKMSRIPNTASVKWNGKKDISVNIES